MRRHSPVSESPGHAPNRRPMDQQPRWRQDFPIDVGQDNYVARRDFTKFMVLTSFAFVVGQFWIGVQNRRRRRRGEPPIKEVARLDRLAPGSAMTFAYPEPHDSCLLLRTAQGELLAYSQRCTHLQCAVQPKLAQARLHCPCHAGYFDMATGQPIAGPPRRPLPRIALTVRGGAVFATGVQRNPARSRPFPASSGRPSCTASSQSS